MTGYNLPRQKVLNQLVNIAPRVSSTSGLLHSTRLSVVSKGHKLNLDFPTDTFN